MDVGDFHLVAQEADLERLVTVDGKGDAFDVAGFGEDVMAAVDAFEFPAFLLEETGKILTGDLFHRAGSHRGPVPGWLHFRLDGDFDHLVFVGGGLGIEFNGQTAFNGFVKIAEEFLLGLALGGATGDSGHFSPKTALFGGMDNSA